MSFPSVLLRLAGKLPLPLLHALGSVLGWLMYGMSPTYRRHLRENLAAARYDEPRVRRAAIAAAGRMIMEAPALWFRPHAEVAAMVREVHGMDQAFAAREARKPVLFLTPHMGCFEVTAQYAGLSISDPKYDPYLALAEEFDAPVAIHLGTMPAGTTFDPCCRTARAAFGHPETVEGALNKHPKLRVNLMHSGWPYIEEAEAMMMLYDNVNIDTGALSWLLPRPAFHDYLRRLVDAGFGKRVMFGSDHMYWPDGIGLAVEHVEAATFLTEQQKRDIFYNNAAAFYKLAPAAPVALSDVDATRTPNG